MVLTTRHMHAPAPAQRCVHHYLHLRLHRRNVLQLAKRKEERDTKRLAEQGEDLKRQLARWVGPEEMRDLQKEIVSFGQPQEGSGENAGTDRPMTEREREKTARVERELREAEERRNAKMADRYSRHAMTVHLAQVLCCPLLNIPTSVSGRASVP